MKTEMLTFCLRFKFNPRQELNRILWEAQSMEQEAVNFLLENNKTSLSSVHEALYYQFRERFEDLHSQWVISALRTATSIVHQFRKRKRKGKNKEPKLKRPFISLSPHLFKVFWDGMELKVVILKESRDPEPITLSFKPHHKYGKVLNLWKEGKYKMGQITLTPTSLSIPFKFPVPQPLKPASLIGIDSNENSLDLFNSKDGELSTLDVSEVPRINRDYDRRVRKGTWGKRNPSAKRKVKIRKGAKGKDKGFMAFYCPSSYSNCIAIPIGFSLRAAERNEIFYPVQGCGKADEAKAA